VITLSHEAVGTGFHQGTEGVLVDPDEHLYLGSAELVAVVLEPVEIVFVEIEDQGRDRDALDLRP
jgi:hypothetical protein